MAQVRDAHLTLCWKVNLVANLDQFSSVSAYRYRVHKAIVQGGFSVVVAAKNTVQYVHMIVKCIMRLLDSHNTVMCTLRNLKFVLFSRCAATR